MNSRNIFFLIILLLVSLNAQETTQTFLSLKNTGVESFQNKYPDFDGRGTIILVLDTGVDMGVEGLISTSTGETKVIDIQDFTGQGDVRYFEAEVDIEDGVSIFSNEENNLSIIAKEGLPTKSTNNDYYIGLLKETLWMNSSSKASDINDNGSKKDKFYFILFNSAEEGESDWLLFLDTDADGDLSDESPIRNYNINYDLFVLPNKKGLPKFTLGLNIFPEREIVSFVFDDGSHGTHCAGIAAGYKIGDNDLHGVAPGAKIVGLKLGNNNYSGGATVAESMKKSYLYADKLSKESEEPCIINMSYGIGSEIEGLSDIELFLEELTSKNPYLYISTSNGNLGPGISTSGMPSSSNAVFSSGAVLAEEVGNDLYGTSLNKDIILHFSSRGGEVSKPDVVAPGASISTVPNFSKSDIFWGTSMASPYSAGVMAVLVGAIKSEYPNVKIPSRLLYKVIRESAKPMEGYSYIDQGYGLINLEGAYNLLKKYVENNEVENVESYNTFSLAPTMPNNTAPNLYIRDATYLTGNESFNFKVTRSKLNKSEKFYRIFNVMSSAEWLKVAQSKIHIRNNQTASIKANIDEKILSNPGMYNAKIEATRADKNKFSEFDIMATIVVPYQFDTDNNYSIEFEDEKIKPGEHKRYFLKIPYGATSLNIKLNSKKNTHTSIRYYLHDPEGREEMFNTMSAITEDFVKMENFNDLIPGVYEFVVLGQYTSRKQSIYDIEFDLVGINLLGHSINDGKITIANYLPESKNYSLKSKVIGYQKEINVNLIDEYKYEIPFEFDVKSSEIRFDISLDKLVFNKMTDFALMILDENGKALKTGAVAYKDKSITINKKTSKGSQNLKLVMIPGFANGPSNISFKVKKTVYFENPIEIKVLVGKESEIKMYPDVKYTLNFNLEFLDTELDNDEWLISELSFISTKSNIVEHKKIIPIKK